MILSPEKMILRVSAMSSVWMVGSRGGCDKDSADRVGDGHVDVSNAARNHCAPLPRRAPDGVRAWIALFKDGAKWELVLLRRIPQPKRATALE